jgi:hypothetical protein
VVSHCLKVVDNLKVKMPCRYVMILKEIEFSSSFNVDMFSHELRESNGDARSLVKAVVSLLVCRYVWLLETHEITCIP